MLLIGAIQALSDLRFVHDRCTRREIELGANLAEKWVRQMTFCQLLTPHLKIPRFNLYVRI
jgi:hypothetical protein